MNHIYRIVWNQTTACWQAVCETAKGHPRGTSRRASVKQSHSRLRPSHAAMLCGFGLMASTVGAAPTGGQVSAGAAFITQSGATTTIQQASQRAAIDWTGFSVGKTESVRFNQPNASAITLNRVTGTERSDIQGSLSASGQVFILNPNGVLFGKGAQVNVGGIVASTLRMSNEDFMAGNFRLTEGPNARASVSNEGEIRVAEGGVLALIAPVVTNTGTLAAPQGSVLMAAADAVSVTLQDGSLVSYTLDKGNLQALVDNGGVIHAEGGHVVLTAKGLDALSRAVVNHSGVIEAQTVSTKNGVVELLGDMEVGQVNLSGRIDASAPISGVGGSVEIRAEKVAVSGTARVSTLAAQGPTGNWIIVGADNAIAPSGGTISGALLSVNLADTNVTIQNVMQGMIFGSGDIYVNDGVSWNSNKLTLTASRNIYINATMSGGGAARLAFEYGLGSAAAENPWDYFLGSGAKINLPEGPSFSTKMGVGGSVRGYTVVNSLGSEGGSLVTTLQGIGSNGNHYGYALGSDIDAAETRWWNSGAGFNPIDYLGNFDGLGHSISNLYINRPSEEGVGLIRRVSAPRSMGGSQWVDRDGTIRNLSVNEAYVVGKNRVGIVAGSNGSVGVNLSSSGAVAGEGYGVGGVFGELNGGSISSSFSSATVRGGLRVGGLIGESLGGTVANCYATGDVTLTQRYFSAGGLVGLAYYGAKVLNSYSTGQVFNLNGGGDVGGLIGSMLYDSSASASYFDSDKSGMALSAGGEARKTNEMQQQKTFSGWDFAKTWRIVEGSSYPMLRALTQGKITLTAAARDVAKVYNKVPWFGGGVVDYSGFAGADSPGDLSGSIQWSGTSQGAIDAGVYTLIPSGLYSQKYEIDFKPATLYIAPRILDVSVSKPYDGSGTFKTGFSVKNVLPGDTVNITGEATVAGADAGTYTAFTSNTLSTGNKNYTLNPVNTLNHSYGSFGSIAATIDPAPVRLLGMSGRRVYDGTPNAYWNDSISFQGVIEADKEKVYLASGSGTLSGKDVGVHRLLSLDSLRLDGASSGNYILDLNESYWTITPRPVRVSSGSSTRKVGEPNPVITDFFVEGSSFGRGLVEKDSVSDVVNLIGDTATPLAPPNSLHVVTPSRAVFVKGDPHNYVVEYVSSGRLLVLPTEDVPKGDVPKGDAPKGDVRISSEELESAIHGAINYASLKLSSSDAEKIGSAIEVVKSAGELLEVGPPQWFVESADLLSSIHSDVGSYGAAVAFLFQELKALDGTIDAVQKKIEEAARSSTEDLLDAKYSNGLPVTGFNSRTSDGGVIERNEIIKQSVKETASSVAAFSNGLSQVSSGINKLFLGVGIFENAQNAKDAIGKVYGAIGSAVDDIKKIGDGLLKGFSTKGVIKEIESQALKSLAFGSDPFGDGFNHFKSVLEKIDGADSGAKAFVNGKFPGVGGDLYDMLSLLKESSANSEDFYKNGVKLFFSLKAAYDGSKKAIKLVETMESVGVGSRFDIKVEDRNYLFAQYLIIQKVKDDHSSDWKNLMKGQLIKKPVPGQFFGYNLIEVPYN